MISDFKSLLPLLWTKVPAAPGFPCPADPRCEAAAVFRPSLGHLSSKDLETDCHWTSAPPCWWWCTAGLASRWFAAAAVEAAPWSLYPCLQACWILVITETRLVCLFKQEVTNTFLVTSRVGGTRRRRYSRPWQTGQLLWSGWRRLRLWGVVRLRWRHGGHRGLVVRRRHGSSVVRRDGHDRVGPDLTQLPLLLPPLPLPGNASIPSSLILKIRCINEAVWHHLVFFNWKMGILY